MRNFWIGKIAALACTLLAPCWAHASTPVDAVALLAHSDVARGGGAPGLTWEVVVRSTGGGMQDQDMRMRVKAAETSSLAETLEPIKSKGAKMLQVDRNMWLSKPGLKKPIAISPRQRLSGLAAIGDIAATNYSKDYQAVLLRQDEFKGENCHVLELSARERQATYDKLVYWISVKRGVGVFAEFLSVSGKRLKTAEFAYENTVHIDGKGTAFMSRMHIADEFTDARTTLEYGQPRVQAIPESDFDVSHLE
ncbi:outer membrane lipoprotein-sorting protein [Variovorax paradoxus]|uniref:outer membrane lipoprotein-sorting protein n=1 Tax=Variovorax paradoxus TaxID=34073 RepID=UPI001ABC115C